MTEEQAKAKWCPFAPQMAWATESRVDGASGRVMSVSAPHQVPSPQRCAGSGCMMWRWNMERDHQYGEFTVKGWRTSQTKGRCGLAGNEDRSR